MLFNKAFLTTCLRFLLSSFFTLYALSYVSDYTTKAVMIVLSALYISVSLIAYLYPWKLKMINNYFDYAFILPLTLFSKDPMTIFSLVVPPLYSFPTNMLPLLISIPSSTILLVLSFGLKGFLFSLLILTLSLSPSSIDLLRSLQKERRYFIKLRDAYKTIQSDILLLEKEKKQKEELLNILKLLDKGTPEEYLKGVKGMFSLKAIRVWPLNNASLEEALIDYNKMTFSVPVKLEHDEALVVFHVNHPAELMDESFRESLTQCAKLLSLYISGFEDNPSKEQAKIAV